MFALFVSTWYALGSVWSNVLPRINDSLDLPSVVIDLSKSDAFLTVSLSSLHARGSLEGRASHSRERKKRAIIIRISVNIVTTNLINLLFRL